MEKTADPDRADSGLEPVRVGRRGPFCSPCTGRPSPTPPDRMQGRAARTRAGRRRHADRGRPPAWRRTVCVRRGYGVMLSRSPARKAW
jgi:hypothetical protein